MHVRFFDHLPCSLLSPPLRGTKALVEGSQRALGNGVLTVNAMHLTKFWHVKILISYVVIVIVGDISYDRRVSGEFLFLADCMTCSFV